MTRPTSRRERGFTIVEFTIAAALGAFVVLSLATFYLNAQGMWLDSSLQAMTQRDATLFADEVSQQVALADRAVLTDPSHLYLFRGATQTASVTWAPGDAQAVLTMLDDAGDSRLTEWPATGSIRTVSFRLEPGLPDVVHLDSLEVVTPTGEPVFLATTFALYNR